MDQLVRKLYTFKGSSKALGSTFLSGDVIDNRTVKVVDQTHLLLMTLQIENAYILLFIKN